MYISTNELKLAFENFKKAEELYAKKSSPVIADARIQLGITSFLLKDYKLSRSYLEQVYKQDEKDPRVNYYLGLCCLSGDNDVKQAKRYLKRAQELGVKIPPEIAKKVDL